MTLDEAIRHVEEVVDAHEEKLKTYEDLGEDRVLFEQEEASCRSCAEDHRQLAGWLKELKQLKERKPSEDVVSRKAVNTLIDELARAISDERCCISRGRSTAAIMQDILDLPPVNPQETTGHWIKYGKLYQCSKCKELSCCQGKFCNECGVKMIEPESEDKE